MHVSQSDVLPVTLAEDTVLTIRESNSYDRRISFKNLTTAILSFKIQNSDDGGATWADHVSTFTVAVGALVVQEVTESGILRILGSGITDTQAVLISYDRNYLDATYVWTSPVV